MVLVILYAGVGIYLGVLACGWIHKGWWAKIDPYTRTNVRAAVWILAVGGIALAIYHAHLYSEFRQRPPELKQEMQQRDRQQQQDARPTPLRVPETESAEGEVTQPLVPTP
ncbi:MAG: hypothetical protein NXI24_03990 [bacterium]|nr:hypothetical protein [bacterium]